MPCSNLVKKIEQTDTELEGKTICIDQWSIVSYCQLRNLETTPFGRSQFGVPFSVKLPHYMHNYSEHLCCRDEISARECVQNNRIQQMTDLCWLDATQLASHRQFMACIQKNCHRIWMITYHDYRDSWPFQQCTLATARPTAQPGSPLLFSPLFLPLCLRVHFLCISL